MSDTAETSSQTTTTPAATTAATDAAQGAAPSWDSIRTAAIEMTGAPPDAVETGAAQSPAAQPAAAVTPAETTAGGTDAPEPIALPEPVRPRSKAERLFLKHAKAQAEAGLTPLQAQLEAKQREIEQRQSAFEAEERALRQAEQEGNLDEVLRRRGLGSVEEYARRQIEGAARKDPAVSRLEAELQALRDERRQELTQAEQRQQELQQRQQDEAEAAEFHAAVEESQFQGARELAALKGFTALSRQEFVRLMREPGAVPEQAFAQALANKRAEYYSAYQQLQAVFGEQPPAGASTPGQGRVTPAVDRGLPGSTSPPVSLPQSGSVEAGEAGFATLTGAERWEAIKSQVLAQS